MDTTALQVSVFREVCQIVANSVPPTECLKQADLCPMRSAQIDPEEPFGFGVVYSGYQKRNGRSPIRIQPVDATRRRLREQREADHSTDPGSAVRGRRSARTMH
jgi:hypothetical protein